MRRSERKRPLALLELWKPILKTKRGDETKAAPKKSEQNAKGASSDSQLDENARPDSKQNQIVAGRG